MTTPDYNPPTKKSWWFSFILCLLSVVIFAAVRFQDCSNPTEFGEFVAKVPYPLMTVSAAWMLLANKFRGI